MKKLAWIGLLFLWIITAVTFAQSGGGFELTWSTVDNGGGTSSSGGFELSGTIGQPDASEPIGNGTFTLKSGFWQSICAAPEAVTGETIQPSGSSVQLGWTSSAVSFNIYRAANDPYFTPGATYASGTSPWTDPDSNVLGNVVSNYTYLIRANSNCGESTNGRRLGEFDFPIVPGS